MSRVCINAGHAPNGIPDPGAVNPNTGERESDFTLQAANMLAKYLNEAGVETMIIQNDDLDTICAESNQYNADAFVSIHCNASEYGNARGTEVWYKTNRGGILAGYIQKQITDSLNTVNRGIKKTDRLYVLNQTDAVAALVEMAFIDNDEDLYLLKNELDTIVRGIARGVTDYFQRG